MKKRINILLTLLLLALPMLAQSAKTGADTPIKSTKRPNIFKQAGNTFKRAGQKIGRTLGIDRHDRDDVRVGDTYYMPLYDTNLYRGSETQGLQTVCRSRFMAKYPNAIVQTCVLPQQGWLSQDVVKNEQIVGYLQTMYCFIIAKDGNDGYINAKFEFQRYRDVGKNWGRVADKWPSWMRTDIIPMADYQMLVKKSNE